MDGLDFFDRLILKGKCQCLESAFVKDNEVFTAEDALHKGPVAADLVMLQGL